MSSDRPIVSLIVPKALQVIVSVACVCLGHGHLWTKCPYVNGSCIVSNLSVNIMMFGT